MHGRKESLVQLQVGISLHMLLTNYELSIVNIEINYVNCARMIIISGSFLLHKLHILIAGCNMSMSSLPDMYTQIPEGHCACRSEG